MTPSIFFRYTLPALFMGVLTGYFVSNTLSPSPSRGGKPRTGALQPAFASNEEANDGAVDYRKLARACLAAAGQERVGNPLTGRQAEELDPEIVRAAQDELDRVLSVTLEKGQWTESAGRHVQALFRKLPPTEAMAFTESLQAAAERGDLKVQFGAWFPAESN
jgi:hypothetical protein